MLSTVLTLPNLHANTPRSKNSSALVGSKLRLLRHSARDTRRQRRHKYSQRGKSTRRHAGRATAGTHKVRTCSLELSPHSLPQWLL